MPRILLFVVIGLALLFGGLRLLSPAKNTPPAHVAPPVDPLAPAPQPPDELPDNASDGDNSADDGNDDEADRPRLPKPFQGEWNNEQALCGTVRGKGRLVVGPDWIQYQKSDGTVSVVRQQSDRLITVVAGFTDDTGQDYDRTIRLQLSPSGKEISTEDGLTRQRCPADKEAESDSTVPQY